MRVHDLSRQTISRTDLRRFRPYCLLASQSSVALSMEPPDREYVTMTKVEVTKIEEQGNGRLLFNVRAYASEGRIEFPIGIQDLGSSALDEIAVLRSTLGFADELAASIRQSLGLKPQNP